MVDMLEFRQGKMVRIVSDPRLFTDEDKRVAYDSSLTYVCRCAPGKDLRYRFSKDLRFYPIRKGDIASEHAVTCPFSDQYEKNKDKGGSGSPITSRDKLTGEIRASVFENIMKPLSSSDRDDDGVGSEGASSGDGEDRSGRIRFISIIRDVNLELSQKQASSFKKKVRSFAEINRWLYMRSKEVPLDNRGGTVMINNTESSVKFIYEELVDITACKNCADGSVKECSLKAHDYDAKAFYGELGRDAFKYNVITSFTDMTGKVRKRRIFSTRAAVNSALKAAIRAAGKEASKVFIKVRGGHVIAVGYEYDFVYKDDMGLSRKTRRLGRLFLLGVSAYGIACSGSNGAVMQDICYGLMKDEKDVRFYMACGEDMYGVITVDGCPVKAFIRIKGDKNPHENGSDLAIKWNPEKEDKDALKGKVMDAIRDMRCRVGDLAADTDDEDYGDSGTYEE